MVFERTKLTLKAKRINIRLLIDYVQFGFNLKRFPEAETYQITKGQYIRLLT